MNGIMELWNGPVKTIVKYNIWVAFKKYLRVSFTAKNPKTGERLLIFYLVYSP